ncbi:MAG: alpha/beta hydrolase family protein [Burkholderiaceae bacterium]
MKTNYMALKAAGHAFFRMTNQGLDHSLVRAGMERVESDADWFPTWFATGEMLRELAEEKLAAGHAVSAGQLLTKASLAYHFAQYLHFSELEHKARAAASSAGCYTRALPLQRVRGQRLQVPYEGLSLPAVLRVQEAREPAPLAILVCGSDSAKEEHFNIECELHARGLATLSFDGPGQGEVAAQMPMHAEYHRAVAEVVGHAARLPGVDARRIGVVGFGFGGLLAVSAACNDPRIAACVSVSGYFDMGIMDWSDPIRAWRFAHLVGVRTLDEARQRAEQFTLDGCMDRMSRPLLVLHGGADAGVPAEAARRIAERAGSNAEFIEIAGGVHCFHNVSWKTTPLIGDWLVGRLTDS